MFFKKANRVFLLVCFTDNPPDNNDNQFVPRFVFDIHEEHHFSELGFFLRVAIRARAKQ
jgi:hypothetical protein